MIVSPTFGRALRIGGIFTQVLSRKSNKSSRVSIANSRSLASDRNATSHQANNVPKHRENNNGRGKRRGDRRLCQRSPMAASMRLQLLGQETLCEALCCSRMTTLAHPRSRSKRFTPTKTSLLKLLPWARRIYEYTP